MVPQDRNKYHGDKICYIVIYYGVLCDIGIYAGIWFMLNCNNNLY